MEWLGAALGGRRTLCFVSFLNISMLTHWKGRARRVAGGALVEVDGVDGKVDVFVRLVWVLVGVGEASGSAREVAVGVHAERRAGSFSLMSELDAVLLLSAERLRNFFALCSGLGKPLGCKRGGRDSILARWAVGRFWTKECGSNGSDWAGKVAPGKKLANPVQLCASRAKGCSGGGSR